jgi:hypothetical protein
VLTPHPRAHALFADKRNLTLLTDEAVLAGWASTPRRGPRCSPASRARGGCGAQAEDLWARAQAAVLQAGRRLRQQGGLPRRQADEAGVRGDPRRRLCGAGAGAAFGAAPRHGEAPVDLKLDLRNYTYRGRVQLVTARLYQGQTTNFRTPGGGFAPVLTVPQNGRGFNESIRFRRLFRLAARRR